MALFESQGLREGNSVDASNSEPPDLATLSLPLARPAFLAVGDEGADPELTYPVKGFHRVRSRSSALAQTCWASFSSMWAQGYHTHPTPALPRSISPIPQESEDSMILPLVGQI